MNHLEEKIACHNSSYRDIFITLHDSSIIIFYLWYYGYNLYIYIHICTYDQQLNNDDEMMMMVVKQEIAWIAPFQTIEIFNTNFFTFTTQNS